MFDWLAAPIDAARTHDVGALISWHARLMVLAWAVLVPAGVLVARFFKVWPGQDWPIQLDNQKWWILHRTAQYGASLVMILALGLILLARGSSASTSSLHATFGWTVLVLALFQIVGGLARGTKGGPTEVARTGTLQGDHYDMTRRRIIFESVHKVLGYAALALSVLSILSGLWVSNAPKWMWLLLMLWWAIVVLLFVHLQGKGRVIDTYQAIWGTNPELPGNKRNPVSLGNQHRKL